MPVFEYRGLNDAGKPVNGLKEAESAKALRAVLRKDGVFLTDVLGEATKAGTKGGAAAGSGGLSHKNVTLKKVAGGRVTTDDIAITTRQLSTLLHAGVSLVEALNALTDQSEKEVLKRVLSDVKSRVNEGSSLADAMAQHPKVFNVLYTNMVRAGESSGAMDSVLARMADFTESQARLQQKIVGTMLYPAIMLAMGGGILVLLMVVVVPKVTKIFTDMKATLPITTRALIAFSDVLQHWWFLIIPAFVGGIFAFRAWTASEKGKPVWDAKVLKLPLFGNLVRLVAVARFSRTLATLLRSGVPMLPAMEIVRNVVTNSVLRAVIENARDAIREGDSIAAPLKRSGEFPPLVYHMVAIGERSGQLEEMLFNVADAYETQVNVRISALTSLLEPLLIVVMGVIIAFVAFSILMPILQLNSSIR